MWYRQRQWKIAATEFRTEQPDAELLRFVTRIAGREPEEWAVLGRSTDARRGSPALLYDVAARFDAEVILPDEWETAEAGEIEEQLNGAYDIPELDARLTGTVVVGTGPGGIFAALLLALAGRRPLVLDRGREIESRAADIEKFIASRSLDEESNLLIGEGGAGAFSDGKLYTRTRDAGISFVLRTMVEAGAPPEIRYLKRPHIGSDRLRGMAAGLRKKIEALGGTFRFGCDVVDVVVEKGRCAGVRLASGETVEAPAVIIAHGQGGRALTRTLMKRGIEHAAKGFQLGCRIEHLQEWVDKRQYRMQPRPIALQAAEYQLHTTTQPGASTFCMCPGGEIVMASAWRNQLTTNGMSLYARSGVFANSCLIATFDANGFGGCDKVFDYLDDLEHRAFLVGGADYAVPAQNAHGFLRGRAELTWKESSSRTGMAVARIDELLPKPATAILKRALKRFDELMPGFISGGKIMGVESCVSSPIRFLRNPETLASSLPGLYLVGEGAGCAGGIVSSAVDGLRVVRALRGSARSFAPATF